MSLALTLSTLGRQVWTHKFATTATALFGKSLYHSTKSDWGVVPPPLLPASPTPEGTTEIKPSSTTKKSGKKSFWGSVLGWRRSRWRSTTRYGGIGDPQWKQAQWSAVVAATLLGLKYQGLPALTLGTVASTCVHQAAVEAYRRLNGAFADSSSGESLSDGKTDGQDSGHIRETPRDEECQDRHARSRESECNTHAPQYEETTESDTVTTLGPPHEQIEGLSQSTQISQR